MDTACVLAQLQEEVADTSRKKELRRPDSFAFPKMATKGPFPLPIPPRIDKGGPSAAPFERRESDHNRQRPFDEKMSALRAYRRVRGLCDKCAERWNKGHRCAEQVQLHALQELWELC